MTRKRKAKKNTKTNGARSNVPVTSSRTGRFAMVGDRDRTQVAVRLCAITGAACVVAAFVWAFWPTFRYLLSTWEHFDDYSHGYLVIPMAVLFAWLRRDSFPKQTPRLRWPGLVLVVVAGALRYLSAKYYLEPVDGWALILWVSGVVWFVGGWAVFRWSLPSLLFLFFMVRLPWRLEMAMRLPLQRLATLVSSWVLQCFGLPAFAENNVIIIDELRLEVERACSGLRIFIGIFAVAYALATLIPTKWWEKCLLFLAAVPVAIVANVTRIVATGLLLWGSNGQLSKQLIHDAAGWLMIPYAVFVFIMLIWFFEKLFPKVQYYAPGELARELVRD